jgi:peptidoglycan/LPS O-acetylase OafA/YrhL
VADGRGARIKHVAALDGARGLAVAGVLLFHAGHLTGGYLGVDFFFTLSGFLITSLLLAEAGRDGHIGLGGFWSRRARRLLPALAVLIVGIGLYCLVLASSTELGQIRGDALATLGYVANWREVFAHQNYFDLFTTPSPLNHTWSLAIEEQFYVVWPLLFVGVLSRARTRTPQVVLALALGLAAVSTTLMIVLFDPNNPSRVYFGTDTRATAILLGAALAAWNAWHPATNARGRRIALEVVGIAGAVLLAIAWLRVGGESSGLYRGGFLLYGAAATAVIAAAVHPEPGVLGRVLSFRPLCALGLISYGVYLYHWPIDVAFDSKRMGFSGWPLFGFQTALTLAIATISYVVLEQPIRHGARTPREWRRFVPAIALALVVAIFAATAGATATETFASLALNRDPLKAASQAYHDAPPGSVRVLLVGDSVAGELGPAFQNLKTAPRLSIVDAAIPGCAFPDGITQTAIRFPNGAVLPPTTCLPNWYAAAVARYRPTLVILVLAGLREGTYHGQTVTPCDAPYHALVRPQLHREISMFQNRGAKVVVTTTAYNRAPFLKNTDRDVDCDNTMRRVYAQQDGAQLVDLFDYVCPHGQCRGRQGGVVLRPDGLHYQGAGGTIIARWIVSQVTSPTVSTAP